MKYLPELATYHRPKTIAEADKLLKENEGYVPMGGGTWLVPNGGKKIKGVVDLSKAGFDEIRYDTDSFHIGSSVTLENLLKSEEASGEPFSAIGKAISMDEPSNIIRSASTVGGRVFLASGDSTLLAVLASMNAQVVIFGRIAFDVELWDYVTDLRSRPVRGIVSSVEIKQREGVQRVYIEDIRAFDSARPVLTAVLGVRHSGSVIRSMRLVFASTGERLQRASISESLLSEEELTENILGKAIDSALTEITLKASLQGSVEYKKEMIGVLTGRLLDRMMKGLVGKE